MNNTKTLHGVLWIKFLTTLENSTWSDILKYSFKCLIFTFLSLSVINVPFTIKLLKQAWFFYDFVILKLFIIFIIVFYNKSISKTLKNIKNELYDFIKKLKLWDDNKKDNEMKTFFNIPIFELADYIFENKNFKRDEVEKVFWLPRNRFDNMAKQMDYVKIFVRGENNSRILNQDMSRSDIISILESYDWNKLYNLIRKIDSCTYSSSPSMPDIIDKSIPYPSHWFVTKPIITTLA